MSSTNQQHPAEQPARIELKGIPGGEAPAPRASKRVNDDDRAHEKAQPEPETFGGVSVEDYTDFVYDFVSRLGKPVSPSSAGFIDGRICPICGRTFETSMNADRRVGRRHGLDVLWINEKQRITQRGNGIVACTLCIQEMNENVRAAQEVSASEPHGHDVGGPGVALDATGRGGRAAGHDDADVRAGGDQQNPALHEGETCWRGCGGRTEHAANRVLVLDDIVRDSSENDLNGHGSSQNVTDDAPNATQGDSSARAEASRDLFTRVWAQADWDAGWDPKYFRRCANCGKAANRLDRKSSAGAAFVHLIGRLPATEPGNAVIMCRGCAVEYKNDQRAEGDR